MKLAVFGCSHTGCGPREFDETWPYFLYKDTRLTITNYAVGGSSTQFQYEIFKKEIDNYDAFIFQFTSCYRLTEMKTSMPDLMRNSKYSFYDIHTGDALECYTPGRFGDSYSEWIKNDNGKILEDYQEICVDIFNHEKCLFCFYMTYSSYNVDNIPVLTDLFPDLNIHPDRHLGKEGNQYLAEKIKGFCKL